MGNGPVSTYWRGADPNRQRAFVKLCMIVGQTPSFSSRDKMTTMHIRSEPHASHEEIRAIQNAVDAWQAAPEAAGGHHDVVIALRDDHSRIRGGVIGDIKQGWLRIVSLWVDPSLPFRATGSKLLAAAESEALAGRAHGATVETFTATTRPFYESQGYSVFAAVEDFPPGHDYYMLRKIFSPPSP